MPEVTHPRLINFKWLGHALSPFGDKNWVAHNIPSKEQDWKFLISVGSRHPVLPALYHALRNDGVLSELPNEIRDALEGFHYLNQQRNSALRGQILELSHLLNAVDVTPVWLKGATSLIRDDWTHCARMMVDLDFWVPDERQHDSVLMQLSVGGYKTIEAYPEENNLGHHHFAPRFKEWAPASVEIHRHIFEAQFDDLLSDGMAVNRIEWVIFEGNQVGQLCSTDRLMNSYLQCIHFHGNLNGRQHERALTSVISFRKTLDFLERFSESTDAVREEFFSRFHSPARLAEAKKFFSILSFFFGLQTKIDIDKAFLNSISFATEHARLLYGAYMVKHAISSAANGRLGPPRGWGRKLALHLTNLYSR